MTPQELKALRKSRNLTQRELAKELGYSVYAVTSWEVGRSDIPPLVEKHLLHNVELALPISLLGEMHQAANARGCTFDEILFEAVREWCRKTQEEKSEP